MRGETRVAVCVRNLHFCPLHPHARAPRIILLTYNFSRPPALPLYFIAVMRASACNKIGLLIPLLCIKLKMRTLETRKMRAERN